MRKELNAFAVALVGLVVLALASPLVAAEENHKPCLRQATIRPIDGVAKTSFVALVEYYDLDGDAPARVEVYVDGVAYPMRLVRGRAENGTYRARLTLPPGEHSYYFFAEDGRGMNERFPRYGAKFGPFVGVRKPYNRLPMLTEGCVHFDYGTEKNLYTFAVDYRDRDEDVLPRAVRVVVDGIVHEMKLHKGTPNNGSYLYTMALPAGPHAYYFSATDGDGDCVAFPRHGFLRGPEVTRELNALPRLLDHRVEPPAGGPGTRFTYRVNYRDEDRDPASVALVYIDDIPFAMRFNSGKPYAGVYTYRTKKHLGVYHDYYFYFEDGRGGVCRYPERGQFHGPVVTK